MAVDNPIGRMALCRNGRLGVVENFRTELRHDDFNVFRLTIWTGTGVDGKPWESSRPRFLKQSDSDIIIDALWGRKI